MIRSATILMFSGLRIGVQATRNCMLVFMLLLAHINGQICRGESVESGLRLELVPPKEDSLAGEPIVANLVAENTLQAEVITFLVEDITGWNAGYDITGADQNGLALKRIKKWPYTVDGGRAVPIRKCRCLPGQEVSSQIVLQRFVEFAGSGRYSISVVYYNCTLHDNHPQRTVPFNAKVYSNTSHVTIDPKQEFFSVSNKFDITIKPFDEIKVLSSAREQVEKAFSQEMDRQTRLEAIHLLGYYSGSKKVYMYVVSSLLQLLADPLQEIGVASLDSLQAVWSNPITISFPVEKSLSYKDEILNVLYSSMGMKSTDFIADVVALGKIGDARSIPYLMQNMNIKYQPRKQHAMYSLEQIGLRGARDEALAALKSLLESADDEFRKTIEASMHRLKSHGAAGK